MSRSGADIIARSRLLADLFETDVQSYQPALDTIAGAIDHAHEGRTAAPIHGNVYTLAITSAFVRISNARDHQVAPEQIPLADFVAAFHHWTAPRP